MMTDTQNSPPVFKSWETQNLPFLLSSFVGREYELAEVARLVTENRLVTLSGTGGCGKTRLALEVAAAVTRHFVDNIALVELAAQQDEHLIPQTILTVLGLREQHDHDPIDTLSDYLKTQRMLLVMDNCEHLINGCATLVHQLLTTCADLHVLATSREVLGVSGEMTWLVPPLKLPDMDSTDINQFLLSDSVQLFEQRATSANSRFQLTAKNVMSVAKICHQLDGIPLAIELAAAQAHILSPEQIDERLRVNSDLLRSTHRMTPARQMTLHATIDWSYDTVSDQERVLFHRIAVFVGGFTLEAVEAICSSEPLTRQETLSLLTGLVNKSLVVVGEQGSVTRYRLLETVRQYAHEKLQASGESGIVEQQHTQYFVELVQEASPYLKSGERNQWLIRLDAEMDNIRSVIQRCQDHQAADVEALVISQLSYYWYFRGYLRESRQRSHDLLTRTSALNAELRADVLWVLAASEWVLGTFESARDHLLESVAICRKEQNPEALAYALTLLALLTRLLGDSTVAYEHHHESLQLFQASDDKWGLALTQYWLADAYRLAGDIRQARHHYEQALAIFTGIGDSWGMALPLQGLGSLEYRTGAYDAAQHYLEECLRIRRIVGDKWLTAQTLVTLASVLLELDNVDSVVTHLEEGLVLYRESADRRGISYTLRSLGFVRLQQGNLIETGKQLYDGLRLSHQIGHQTRLAECVIGLAAVALEQSDATDAVQLLAFVAALARLENIVLHPRIQQVYQSAIELAQQRLDEQSYQTAWDTGVTLTATAVISLCSDAQRLAKQAAATAIMPTSQLYIRALGSDEVYRDGVLVASSDWQYAKVKDLFFYLLNHDGATKEEIGLVLWPEASPAQLRSAFHDTLYHLRRVLGTRERIFYQNKRYHFNRDLAYSYDVEIFEAHIGVTSEQPHEAKSHWQAAVELYRGDFLQDCFDSDWLMPRQAALRQMYLDTLLALGERLIEEDDYPPAVQIFRRAIDHDNLLEAAHRDLMRCYALMGENGQALRQYQQLAVLLQTELDAQPAPETQMLYRQLQQGKVI